MHKKPNTKAEIWREFNRARRIHRRMKNIRSIVRRLLSMLDACVTVCDGCHEELEGIRKRQAKRFRDVR